MFYQFNMQVSQNLCENTQYARQNVWIRLKCLEKNTNLNITVGITPTAIIKYSTASYVGIPEAENKKRGSASGGKCKENDTEGRYIKEVSKTCTQKHKNQKIRITNRNINNQKKKKIVLTMELRKHHKTQNFQECQKWRLIDEDVEETVPFLLFF